MAKTKCPYGCGKTGAPGPMAQHAKFCASRPASIPEPVVIQPTGKCKWGCGLETTRGALATHELYGCELRPEDGPAIVRCQFCGKVDSLGGAMTSHERHCPSNPDNPQRLGGIDKLRELV